MLNINSEEFHVKLGQFIRNARKEQNLRQWEVAEKVGITQVYMSYIERGERDVDLFLAMKICDVLNADMRLFVSEYIE